MCRTIPARSAAQAPISLGSLKNHRVPEEQTEFQNARNSVLTGLGEACPQGSCSCQTDPSRPIVQAPCLVPSTAILDGVPLTSWPKSPASLKKQSRAHKLGGSPPWSHRLRIISSLGKVSKWPERPWLSEEKPRRFQQEKGSEEEVS